MIRRKNDQKMTRRVQQLGADQGDLTGMFGFLAASKQLSDH